MMIKKTTLCLLNIDTILRSMWQALKLDYVCCTEWCDVSGLRPVSRVSCLMCHVQSLISPPLLPLSPRSPAAFFWARGLGKGHRTEITRPGPDPASCQLTRKIPGLNWLTLAAKYFAETDCEYFSSGTETLGGTRRGRSWDLRSFVCLGCGGAKPPQFALFNGEFSHRDPGKPGLAVGASPPDRAGQAESRHKICKQTGPSQCLQKVWYSQSFVCVKQHGNPLMFNYQKKDIWTNTTLNKCDCDCKCETFSQFNKVLTTIKHLFYS